MVDSPEPERETKEAFNYAKNLWRQTHHKRRLEAIPILLDKILEQLNKTRALRSDKQNNMCDVWRAKVKRLIEKDLASLEVGVNWFGLGSEVANSNQQHVREGVKLAADYRATRKDVGIIAQPCYHIDPTLSSKALTVQMDSNVHREARHLSSKIYDEADIELHRSIPGGCELKGCKHITADLTREQEMAEINELKDLELEEDYWVDEKIAKWANVTRLGRPKGFDWSFTTHLHGYGPGLPLPERKATGVSEPLTEEESRMRAEAERQPSLGLSTPGENDDFRLSPSPGPAEDPQPAEQKKPYSFNASDEQEPTMKGVRHAYAGQGPNLPSGPYPSLDPSSSRLNPPPRYSSALKAITRSLGAQGAEMASPDTTTAHLSTATTPFNATAPSTAQELSGLALSERPKCFYCNFFGIDCDKALPKCSYCARLDRECTYDMGFRHPQPYV